MAMTSPEMEAQILAIARTDLVLTVPRTLE
jgi:hypothetical protein